MKIERVFFNEENLAAALDGERELRLPVGYAYCSEEQGKSASVFIATDRDTGEVKRTKGGDIQFNIRIKDAQGDHDAEAVEAEAAPL